MTFGERICHFRKQKNLTQEQLAEQIGVTRQAVSRWEQDAAQPELDKLVLLVRELEVSADILLGLQAESEVPEARDAPQILIRFLRKLWHNLGWFMLLWGALFTLAVVTAAILMQISNRPGVVAVIITSLAVTVCGLALVLFRRRRKSGDKR